jgi:hypothetical protein
MIETVRYDQQEIIRDILTLHVKSDTFDLDPTFSKGAFYSKGIPRPKLVSDIEPAFDYVT